MNKVIALLTDFGEGTHYVAAMKAVILSRCPDVRFLDITHRVPPQDIKSAAFILQQFVLTVDFSAIYLTVVDPGVGSPRLPIVIKTTDGSFFVGPDNGVMWWAVKDSFAEVRVLPVPENASLTFHGRDVFAPAAAEIACNKQWFDTLKPATKLTKLPMPSYSIQNEWIVAEVIFIDSFGNTLISIHNKDKIIKTGQPIAVQIKEHLLNIAYGTYANVNNYNNVWHYDSSGYIELALRNGSFARKYNVYVGQNIFIKQGDSNA